MAEPLSRLTNFRQVVGHDVNTPMHINTLYHVRRIMRCRVTADKIGQKITGKRAVGKVRQMQVSKKIHY